MTKILPRGSDNSLLKWNESSWDTWETDASSRGSHVVDIARVEITYKFDGTKNSTEPAFNLNLSLNVDKFCLDPNTIDVFENFTDKEQVFSRKWRAVYLRPRIPFSRTPLSQETYFNFLCRAVIATTKPNTLSFTKNLDRGNPNIWTDRKMDDSCLSEAFRFIKDRLGEDGFMYVQKRLEMLQVRDLKANSYESYSILSVFFFSQEFQDG